MDFLYLGAAFAIFIAIALLLEGVYTFWQSNYSPEAKRIARRLQDMKQAVQPVSSEVSIEKKRSFSEKTQIQRALQQAWGVRRLDSLLIQSGSKWNVAQFCVLSLAIAAATFAALMLTPLPGPIAAITAIMAGAIPLCMAINKKRKRLARFEEQLPEALDLMSRSLRAGHALPSALKMVSEEMPEPIAGEFRIVFNEVSYGVSVQEALRNLATRIPGSDIGFFVVAVLIQRETGGNLTELLDCIARIVRERLKLFGQIEVFTAEGRLSAWILGLLPFGLAFVLHLVNPNFMKTLWIDPAGQKMLGGVLILMVVGMLWMRKLIRIRV